MISNDSKGICIRIWLDNKQSEILFTENEDIKNYKQSSKHNGYWEVLIEEKEWQKYSKADS